MRVRNTQNLSRKGVETSQRTTVGYFVSSYRLSVPDHGDWVVPFSMLMYYSECIMSLGVIVK